MNIPLESVLLIIAGFINLAFGVLVYLRDYSKKDNAFFGLISFNVSLWAFSLAIFEGTTFINFYTQFAALMLYISASLIPISFLFFVSNFDEESMNLSKTNIFIALISCVVIIALTLTPELIIKKVTETLNNGRIITFGSGYFIYATYIILAFTISFLKLFKKYIKSSKESLIKLQIKYILMGTFVASIIGVTTNLILPTFGNFDFYWLGPVATILMVVIIGYAIAKYNLWDFKLIVVQLLIFLLVSVSLVDIFLVKSNLELAIKLTTFLMVATIGILLIKKILKESDDKDKIKELANDLKIANLQLKKMDKQKSEFINIASHQLRGPIASLKGYSSMILEGSYGPVSKKVEDVVGRLFQSSKSLALIIDDFLNLSRIERGKIEFSFEEGDVKEIVTQSVEEIRPNAVEKKLKLSFEVKDGDYKANIDSDKIKQIISNIIDNSIKYTPKGSIDVSLSKNENNILIKISDTGIGIPKKSMNKLFTKFGRLENANGANISGTGLGLYLAKEVVTAHDGKIWAESEGEGKGTTFYVEIKAL